jgi:hypothetical protein
MRRLILIAALYAINDFPIIGNFSWNHALYPDDQYSRGGASCQEVGKAGIAAINLTDGVVERLGEVSAGRIQSIVRPWIIRLTRHSPFVVTHPNVLKYYIKDNETNRLDLGFHLVYPIKQQKMSSE